MNRIPSNCRGPAPPGEGSKRKKIFFINEVWSMSITKRFLAMLLAVVMVVSMVPASLFATETTALSADAEELLEAIAAGTGYTMQNDIDLGGATIPAAKLTGAFNGGGYTISNAVVEVADDAGNQGFFSSVEAGASVTNLKLENITVNAVGTNVGILAGYVAGSVSGVSVTGTLNDTRARDGINLGVLVGQTAADATVKTLVIPTNEELRLLLAQRLALRTCPRRPSPLPMQPELPRAIMLIAIALQLF